MPTKPVSYSVNLWGSHPDAGNDDCWTGDAYATLAEAQAAAADLKAAGFSASTIASTAYVEIAQDEEDGSTPLSVIKTPDCDRILRRRAREQAREDREWKSEAAMQAGMAFGVDGYNDEMGW